MRITLKQMNFENRLSDQKLDEYKKFMSTYEEDEKLKCNLEHKADNITDVIIIICGIIALVLFFLLGIIELNNFLFTSVIIVALILSFIFIRTTDGFFPSKRKCVNLYIKKKVLYHVLRRIRNSMYIIKK